MLLYHGSNMTISEPRLIPSKRLLDFGSAFYTTSDFEQAKKWAIRTTANRETGVPSVSVYDFSPEKAANLDILTFQTPDVQWLRFIAANRKGLPVKESPDLIIGPVANDQAIRTVNQFLRGYFSEDIAIQLLLPQKLKDQYAFKTEKALQCLFFTEVIHV